MGEISAFDIVASLILLAGMAAGFTRGVVRQLADMAALYIGLAVAAQYSPVLTPSVAMRLPTWPRYAVAALVFFLIVGILTVLLSLLAQGILHGSGKQERNEVSQVVGFALGAIAAAAFLSVAVPVIRYAVIASWGSREATRQMIIIALERSDLRPFFESITPTVLMLIRPFLPTGLPEIVLAGMR